MLAAPSYWMDLLKIWLTPIVIVIVPPIKMDVQLSPAYVSDGCHTDETRILQILCLKLTVDTETTNRFLVFILQTQL